MGVLANSGVQKCFDGVKMGSESSGIAIVRDPIASSRAANAIDVHAVFDLDFELGIVVGWFLGGDRVCGRHQLEAFPEVEMPLEFFLMRLNPMGGLRTCHCSTVTGGRTGSVDVHGRSD